MQFQEANAENTVLFLYSTVNHPADQLHYASIDFQEDLVSVSTEGNALSETDKIDSSCTYASVIKIKHTPPPAEETPE